MYTEDKRNQSGDSQIVVSRPVASAASGKVLQVQILEPQPRPTESETSEEKGSSGT